jgi:ubiquinone biosynthesis protein COQ9
MSAYTPLERIRQRLGAAIGENAVYDGWTPRAVESAATQAGVDPAHARLAVPKGQAAMIGLYVQSVDRRLAEWATPERMAKLKIREKIRALVWQRLQIMAPAREAVRSALAILAMPHNLPRGAALSWQSADLMWRLAGDTSTDFNHYTKRITLSAVYGTTLLAWLDDASENWSETVAFLDRRIDAVMRFEKFKAEWRGSADRRPSLSRFLGRLRYPPR